MDTSQSIVETVAAARGVVAGLGGGDSDRVAAVAVDLFTLFEARMQHHFKRGPFSRKLKALLLEAGKLGLADRVYQYYLAVNVLKHGKGASHRELLTIAAPLFVVNQGRDDAQAPLIDVTKAGFFDGLCETILESYDFLEK